jgi:hypothetical protein
MKTIEIIIKLRISKYRLIYRDKSLSEIRQIVIEEMKSEGSLPMNYE